MKKIRINGIVFHKHDIACLIDMIAPLSCASVIYQHLTYQELCEMLYRQICLKGKKDSLKFIIEWNGNIAPF